MLIEYRTLPRVCSVSSRLWVSSHGLCEFRYEFANLAQLQGSSETSSKFHLPKKCSTHFYGTLTFVLHLRVGDYFWYKPFEPPYDEGEGAVDKVSPGTDELTIHASLEVLEVVIRICVLWHDSAEVEAKGVGLVVLQEVVQQEADPCTLRCLLAAKV